MRPGRWRRLVVRPLVWLIALVALAALAFYLVLGSGYAQERARSLVAARLSEALDRTVRVRRVEWSVLPLAIVVRDLEIAGDRKGAPPFLKVERAEAVADVERLLRDRTLEIRSVAVDGLDVDLEFRADGTDNLPKLARGRGAGAQAIDVELDGLSVTRGRVHLDERTTPFALDARAVAAHFVGAGHGVLDGRVAAQTIDLQLPGAHPTRMTLAARVRLAGERLEVLRARVGSPDLRAQLAGSVAFAPTRIELHGEARGSGAALDRLGWLHGEIGGEFGFSGRFDWQQGGWQVAGDVRSPELELVGFDLHQLEAHLHGDRRAIAADALRADWSGGTVRGSFGVGLGKGFPATLDVVLDRVRIAPALARFGLPIAGLRGAVSGPFAYRFDLLDAADGRGQGQLQVVAEEVDGVELPASGAATVELGGGRVSLPALRWSAAGEQVEGSGWVALEGGSAHFDFQVASEDVGRLVKMLPFLPSGEIWLPTAGTAQMTVALDLAGKGGVGPEYRARVEFAGAALETRALAVERAAGSLVVTPGGVAFDRLGLDRDGAHLELAGTVPLGGGDGGLDLRIEARDWPVSDAWPWLPTSLPIAGPLTGTLRLTGALDALHGTVEASIAPVAVLGVAGTRLDARLGFDPQRLEVAAATFALPAGEIHGSGSLGFERETLDFHLESRSLALDRPPFSSVGGGSLEGTVQLQASIGGTLAEPELTLAGSSRDASLFGRPLGAAREPRIAADWRNGRLSATLEVPGLIHVEGGGELVPGKAAQLDMAVRCDSLSELVALAAGNQLEGLRGRFDATLTVDWPADAAPRARFEIAQGEFLFKDVPFRTREPIRASFDANGLDIQSVYLTMGEGGNDELFVAGHVGAGDRPELGLHVQAQAGAAALAPWIPGLQLGGELTLLADVGGTLDRPALNGEAQWSDGSLIPPVLPHSLERAQALLLFYPQAVVLDHLTGDFAGGRLAAGGRIDVPPSGTPTYRIEATARRVTLRWPAGWQIRGDADLTLMSTANGRQVVGQATLDRVYYVQDIELSPTQLLARLLTRSRVVVPQTSEFLSTTALNVAVRADKTLRVRNNLADLTASADLAIRGTLAQPILFGEVRTEPGGKVNYGGNRYTVERGVLTFANPTRIDPFLDLVAHTRVDEYDVTVDVAGSMSRPVTTFASDPPLPDLEILGLLSTGAPVNSSTYGTLTSSQIGSQSTSVGAEALLYGQAASLVGARVGRLFGFDQVRVQPLTSGDTVSAARVTVGKRLSRSVYVTYSYDPSSTAQQILQVEWRLSDRVVLVMTQNGNESYSVDARWESRF